MKHFKIVCWSECPFCLKAKNLLIEKNMQFEYCSVDHSPELLSHYKTIYNHNTVPIVIVKEEGVDDKLIGGYTELVKFFERGSS
jgi:glutaredoxin 3